MSKQRFPPAYPAELRERGVRLFRENRADYASDTAAYKAIAPKLGCSPVNLRRWPSDLKLNPMVSPSLCPTLSIVLKSKYFPQPMVNAAGIGRMMTNCALWKKASLATAKRQPRRGGMAFAGRC